MSIGRETRKVVVVGAGAVGSTFAFALAQSGLATQIVLIDKNEKQQKGQVLDLAHGLPFYPSVEIVSGSEDDYADARVVVITAGAAQQPGQSRLDLLKKNAAIVEEIVGQVVEQNSPAVIVVATNPVDVLTLLALRKSGWPTGRVIGSGTVLDSARFRYLLSRHCGVSVHNVHAYVLGEHGDSEVAAWSMTHVAGMPIDNYCPLCKKCSDWRGERKKIEETVRNSAYHIIDYKGATYFAIGMALTQIVGAILRDQHGVLTVSTLLDGQYGLRDVCLSVPCLVGAGGVQRVIEGKLAPAEQEALVHSASVLQKVVQQLDSDGRE